MSRMVTADRVDKGTIPDEPALFDMAAEVHELIEEVHRRRRQHDQPANIRGNKPA